MTKKAYDLVSRSYNINNRYSPHIQVNAIMSVENQTIGFITACLKEISDCVRQKRIGNYRADLCINESIVVECDEFGHDDRAHTQTATAGNLPSGRGFMDSCSIDGKSPPLVLVLPSAIC